MSIEIHIPQGSPEWFAERLGRPGASNFDRIVTATGEPSKSWQSYLYELAAERITGRPANDFKSVHMERGTELEPQSRSLYELITDAEVRQVGFVYKDDRKRYGCSPDGLLDPNGGLEMKNVLGKTQVAYLLGGKLPSDYHRQVHGSIFVTEREWWDFFSCSDGLPPFKIRVYRNEAFCKKLESALEQFCDELEEVTEKLRRAA